MQIRRLGRPAQSQAGQVIVVFALGLVAIVVMIGLVIDGGAIFAQQRIAQNGADAAANAGALVLAEHISDRVRGRPGRTGADVAAAIAASAAANGLENPVATYTDDLGQPLEPLERVDPAGAIPANASGVNVVGERRMNTFFAWATGLLPGGTAISELVARADATVVVGPLGGVCPAEAGCGVLPVTFPVAISTCDGKNLAGTVGETWPLVTEPERTSSNKVVVPLCTTSEGSVGWLDFGTGQNLQDAIADPRNEAFQIPTWIRTQTGNVNAVEDEINDNYAGSPILIPLFDGTCRVDPRGTELAACPEDKKGIDPQGNNTWYHIPYFTTFWLERAYIQGNNASMCQPYAGQQGFIGCLHGWFVEYISEGPIVPGRPIGPSDTIGLQLIR